MLPEFAKVAPPGEAVKVQLPVEGKPLKATLPVVVKQSGCVIEPVVGDAGSTHDEVVKLPASKYTTASYAASSTSVIINFI